MKTMRIEILLIGILCVPVSGQTVFLQAQPGPTVDLTDPLNPSVLAGNSIVVDVLLDGTETTAPQVGAFDVFLIATDPTESHPGAFVCSDAMIDLEREGFVLDTCELCGGSCLDRHPSRAALGGMDHRPHHDVDFLAYVGTVTFDATPDADGDWVVGYVQNSFSNVFGGPNGVIIDVIKNPESYIPLTITVRPLPFIMHGDGSGSARGDSLAAVTMPPSGYIDPRRESDNGVDLNQSLQSAIIRFTQPVFDCGGLSLNGALSAFEITTTGGTPPEIASVSYENSDPTQVRVEWIGNAPLQEWMTIRAVDVCNGEGGRILNQGAYGPDRDEPDRIDIAFLPADVNQNGHVNPLDVTAFRQFINGVFEPEIPAELLLDINRDGAVGPLDLTALRQLIYGTENATQEWAFATLNNPRP